MALKRALTAIYWYKHDLRASLHSALSDFSLPARLDWDDYKRNIVGRLVDHLAMGQPKTRDDLISLMTEVARIPLAPLAGFPEASMIRLRMITRPVSRGRPGSDGRSKSPAAMEPILRRRGEVDPGLWIVTSPSRYV